MTGVLYEAEFRAALAAAGWPADRYLLQRLRATMVQLGHCKRAGTASNAPWVYEASAVPVWACYLKARARLTEANVWRWNRRYSADDVLAVQPGAARWLPAEWADVLEVQEVTP